MKLKITLFSSILLITGCGMQVDEAKIKKTPGYDVAKSFCSGCHSLPYGVQNVAAAWPSIVHRMEGHMAKAQRKSPTAQERATIIDFFQKTSAK